MPQGLSGGMTKDGGLHVCTEVRSNSQLGCLLSVECDGGNLPFTSVSKVSDAVQDAPEQGDATTSSRMPDQIALIWTDLHKVQIQVKWAGWNLTLSQSIGCLD